MYLTLEALDHALAWVLKASFQASVLILLVLLALRVFRKRLSPGWRYALWLLVLARFFLPATLPTSWSVFNLAPLAELPADNPLRASIAAAAERLPDSNSAGVVTAAVTAEPAPAEEAISRPPAQGDDGEIFAPSPASQGEGQGTYRSVWRSALGLAWLAGVLGLLAQVIWSGRRLSAALARQHAVVNPAVGTMLAEAQQLIGVRRVLPVVQSRAVASPALMGFIRPWLLLPEGVTGHLTPQELRFVFLHELAHLKRWDILANWLMTMVQLLHWFNPLVWFAFRRMRADRELACDARALRRTSESDRQIYGRAMIKLLEGFTRPTAVADLVGILEDPNLMKDRITMIKSLKSKGRWPWLAPVLLCGFSLVALTDADRSSNEGTPSKPAVQSGQLRRLYRGSGGKQWYAVSPDGRKACYTDWSNGAYGLLNLADGMEVSLLKKRSWLESNAFGHTGAFSPDSRRLAYVAVPDDGPEELRVADAEAGASRVLLTRSSGDIEVHGWSADGTSLVLLSREGGPLRRPRGILLVDAETGAIRREIKLDKPGLGRLRFAPNGRFVAFGHRASQDSADSDVSLLDLSNGRVSPLIQGSGDDYPLEWTGNSDRLLFVSDRRGAHDVWEVTVREGVARGEPSLQVPSAGKIEGLGLTKSGRLHYSASIVLRTLLMTSWTEDSDGGPRLAPTPNRLTRALQGAWSRRGNRFAYFRQDGEGQPIKLCIREEGNGGEKCFDTALPFPLLHDLSWSSDDQSVRFLYFEVKALGTHELAVDSGKIELVDKGLRSVSPDGRWAAHQIERTLELVDRQTGAARKLCEHKDPIARFITFSPSGNHLAYVTMGTTNGVDQNTLWILPRSGGEPKMLFQSDRLGVACWLPDERALLCLAGFAGTGYQQLWKIPSEGGEPQSVAVALNGAGIRSVAFHPDGRQVALGIHEEWTELWGMDLPGQRAAESDEPKNPAAERADWDQ